VLPAEVGATGHRAVLFVYICAGLMAVSGVIMAITLASVGCCCKEQGWEVLARDRDRRVSIGADPRDQDANLMVGGGGGGGGAVSRPTVRASASASQGDGVAGAAGRRER